MSTRKAEYVDVMDRVSEVQALSLKEEEGPTLTEISRETFKMLLNERVSQLIEEYRIYALREKNGNNKRMPGAKP